MTFHSLFIQDSVKETLYDSEDKMKMLAKNIIAKVHITKKRSTIPWANDSALTEEAHFQLLRSNKAKWHHKCALQYDNYKIKRLKPRSEQSDDSTPTSSSSTPVTSPRQPRCVIRCFLNHMFKRVLMALFAASDAVIYK